MVVPSGIIDDSVDEFWGETIELEVMFEVVNFMGQILSFLGFYVL
jgi:hypothetical protein